MFERFIFTYQTHMADWTNFAFWIKFAYWTHQANLIRLVNKIQFANQCRLGLIYHLSLVQDIYFDLLSQLSELDLNSLHSNFQE